MSDWELELDGLRNVVQSLTDLEAAVETDRTFTVGSGVEYSVLSMPSLNRTNSGKRYTVP